MRKLVLLLLVTLGLVLGSVPYEEGKDIGTEGAVETESTQTETEADEEEPTEKAVQVSEENTVSAVSDEEAEEQAKATTNSETKEEKEPKAVENKGQGEQSGRAYEPVQVQNNISDTADCPTSTQEVESEPVVAVRSYSPQSVVAKAIAKCQAEGMITTTDNLNRLLSDGSMLRMVPTSEHLLNPYTDHLCSDSCFQDMMVLKLWKIRRRDIIHAYGTSRADTGE